MGSTESGLTNAQYADWMSNTASQDCGDVAELYIKLTNGSSDTYTNSTEICNIMYDANEQEVSGWQEVKFSGTNGEGPWYAIDDREDVNLERTVNFAEVPLNIKRPTGS